MFVRIKPKPNGKKSIQIVESYRRADKVSQKIVRHVGQAATDREVEEMTRLAQSIIAEMEEEKQPTLPFFDPLKVLKAKHQSKASSDTVKIGDLREEQRMIDGIGDVFGKLYKDLKLGTLISGTHKDAQWNDILESCVLARIANPVSKRRSASLLEEDYGIKIPLEKIYRVMDHVSDREADIKQHIAQTTLSLFQEHVDVLFFDVTTLYFESITTDELREFGFSKDCKFKEVQIVLALVTTSKGLPITYRLFPGNTYEGGTLVEMVKDLQTQYAIDNILLVADRAMFNEENLFQMESLGVQYIVAAKLKTLPRDLKSDILHADYHAAVIENELHWLKEFEHKSRRLIVGYSARRAKKDAADRQRLVDRLMKKVKGDKIQVKDLISNYGSKKYIRVENSSATIHQEKIEADAKWDGLHGVITNVTDKTPSELLSKYRELWQIEEAFRINKHDLKMRPIFHWTENRIKAHIAICFLAFTLAKQAVYRIALQQEPMSFEQIRNELLHAQSSVIIDLASRKKYIIPSHVTVNQKKIYQVFGLKRSAVPYALN
ncbi:MAG TPA: IS1634 family transposase [Smithella sp.]|jgi:transposase|nr:IS1634 family transposase [Smithella sp.]